MLEELEKLREENKTQKEGIAAGTRSFDDYVHRLDLRENRRKQGLKEMLPDQWEIIERLLGDDEEGTAAAAAQLKERLTNLMNPANPRELALMKRANIKLDKLSQRRKARHEFNSQHDKQRAQNFEATRDRLLRDYMTATYGSLDANGNTLTLPGARVRDIFCRNEARCSAIWDGLYEAGKPRFCPACLTKLDKRVSCFKVYPHR